VPSTSRVPLWRIAIVVVGLFAVAVSPAGAAGDDVGEEGVRTPGWYAEFVTAAGSFVIRLLPEQAPQSVAHFAALALGRLEWIDPFTGLPRSDPYYDGLQIHKVRAGMRFEFGDPTATGRGSAPFYVPEEGFGPITFDRGWRVGMTRAPQGRISGSLLFVTAEAQPFLVHRHPCFGVVVAGRELVRNITGVKANSSGKPLQPIVVEHVRVFAVGDPAPLPEPTRYVPEPKRFQLKKDLGESD